MTQETTVDKKNGKRAYPGKQRPVMSIAEVREALGIGHSTMARWLRIGFIERLPGTNYVLRSEYDRFIREGQDPRYREKTPEERKRGRRRRYGDET